MFPQNNGKRIVYNERIPLEQKVYVGNTHLCTFARPFSWQYYEEECAGEPLLSWGWCTSTSYAWVCPSCLRVWAIAPLERHPEFQILPIHCSAHGGGNLIHKWGELYFDPAFIDYGPLPLIEREFHLLLEKAPC